MFLSPNFQANRQATCHHLVISAHSQLSNFKAEQDAQVNIFIDFLLVENNIIKRHKGPKHPELGYKAPSISATRQEEITNGTFLLNVHG